MRYPRFYPSSTPTIITWSYWISDDHCWVFSVSEIGLGFIPLCFRIIPTRIGDFIFWLRNCEVLFSFRDYLGSPIDFCCKLGFLNLGLLKSNWWFCLDIIIDFANPHVQVVFGGIWNKQNKIQVKTSFAFSSKMMNKGMRFLWCLFGFYTFCDNCNETGHIQIARKSKTSSAFSMKMMNRYRRYELMWFNHVLINCNIVILSWIKCRKKNTFKLQEHSKPSLHFQWKWCTEIWGMNTWSVQNMNSS